MINEFITEVCELLGIEIPTVSYDTSHFPTETTLALCAPVSNIIYLKKINTPNFDYMFSIAHELRHLFQYKKDEKFYFANYKPSDKCNSLEEYNLQIAEVDANAFANIVMVEYFHLKPLWKGLSQKVIDSINARINVIISELNS